MKLNVRINGKDKSFRVGPEEVLLDVLRREGYTGVKRGCRKGDCGACAVLIDNELFNSCVLPAMSVAGKDVITIEGIGTPNALHVLQRTFLEEGAVQCGFCTPGMILAVKALLDRNEDPNETEIKEALDGNLCRCTGYVKIIKAVKKAARSMREVGE
ncbi:MAG: (2Fe-2S)-binding protein [Candidatus Thermoplasmatota archaeon]|jgi:aerobic-type carbon monoxide dehydrogenase small subunit (CoxS/CutS family)|nr:(2Fe-2S)-binding protein [Candidatus Thermoplasmatota archaeon]MDP7264991.1 (2Fe-2S)-binding protein [Candidatus Thermoplasmatota archaeon]